MVEHISRMMHWVTTHWATLVSISVAGAILKWFFPSRKDVTEWLSKRAEGKKAKVDALILGASQSREWEGIRPMTGAGYLGITTDELAERLNLNRDLIFIRLRQLEMQERVSEGGPTSTTPMSRWYFIPR